ncbi:hypothetical protein H2201_002039 [Coniosporium apollinis]|uniref:Gfd2/YDR514C-like C-terminal domain-containing protein n=1 Tax=Coniosporium apollinis TaxID=61459 RepID=A0ABQ9P4R0_9PEZI|nr:hypothetical protein H2201_002039 [Coniosporium apollinis]
MSSNTSLQNMALLLAALDHGPSRKGLSADQIAGIDDCIIVSLDFEAWERAPRPVTEFGVLCLDTRDIDISDAGLTIDKHMGRVNTIHVKGCPEDFRFGKSEEIKEADVKDVLESIFRVVNESAPADATRNADQLLASAVNALSVTGQSAGSTAGRSSSVSSHSTLPSSTAGSTSTPLTPPSPPLASSPRYRKIIRADHASGNEDKYLSKLGCSDDVLGTVIGAIDTQVLARARGFGVTTLPQIGLGPLLEIFGVHPAHWHNSGNDAAYTLFATLMMALKAASRGDVLPHHDLLAMGTRLLVKVDALGTGMKLLVPKRFCTDCQRTSHNKDACSGSGKQQRAGASAGRGRGGRGGRGGRR